MENRINNAINKLRAYGQEHALRYYDQLDEQQKDHLLTQIEQMDFSVTQYVEHRDTLPGKEVITPIRSMEIQESRAQEEKFRAIGLDAIYRGKAAAVLLAGG